MNDLKTEIAKVVDNKNGKLNTNGTTQHIGIQNAMPYGFSSNIPKGENVVIMPVGGSAVCVGVIREIENLQQGEVMLYSSGGASIVLKNDGRVLINGRSV